jgi:hypothetical protein
MQLREIAAISGKPGLYRILKPTRAGVIIESMDEKRQRTVAGATSRVSILNDISMYTTDQEGSVPLGEVLMRVFDKQGGKPLTLSGKSDGADLEGLMAEILPNWDSERVYLSDIKKLVTWYNTLVAHAPELFVNEEPAQEEPKEEADLNEGPSAVVAEPADEAKAKKAPVKKAADKPAAKKSDEAPEDEGTPAEAKKASPKKPKA